MHITAHLDVDMVAVETDDEVSVLLELAAPAASTSDEAQRPPATLQVVLDRSGSMAEDDRLGGAKRALLALVDRLDPTDNFGVVVFDEQALVVVPAGPLNDKDAVRRAIADLHVGGMTDISSGYLRGLQEARRVCGDAGATLLLISDGHANQGVTDHDQLRGIARQGHGRGVSTATLGYGLGYDEELLGAIADGGTGDALFAEDPDTAGKLIAGQAEGLLSKAAQAASMTIRLREPVSSRCSSSVSCRGCSCPTARSWSSWATCGPGSLARCCCGSPSPPWRHLDSRRWPSSRCSTSGCRRSTRTPSRSH